MAQSVHPMSIRPLLVCFLTLAATAPALSQAVPAPDNAVPTGKAAGREGGLYLGAYVFPPFRRDWGAVAAIQTRKWYIEASWQKANHNRDYLLDQQLKGEEGARREKAYWDGYYAHLAVNGISRNTGKHGNRSYLGVLLGYNPRTFETVVSNVWDENNTFLGIYEFKPSETRYFLMLNMGQHLHYRMLAADFYFSMGGFYSRSARGNQAFDNDNFSYERNLLKRGGSRFGFAMRVGLTAGLQLNTTLPR